MSAVLVKDGCMRPLVPMNGKKFTLQEMQSYVGGYIEIIQLNEKKIMVVDEDGKRKGKLVNHIATGWLRQTGSADYIVGPVILMDRNMMD